MSHSTRLSRPSVVSSVTHLDRVWTEQRPFAVDLAYRMLGNIADAEDGHARRPLAFGVRAARQPGPPAARDRSRPRALHSRTERAAHGDRAVHRRLRWR